MLYNMAGGVGSFAVQLAKARVARVLATCPGQATAFVKGLGADHVIDYIAVKDVGGRP